MSLARLKTLTTSKIDFHPQTHEQKQSRRSRAERNRAERNRKGKGTEERNRAEQKEQRERRTQICVAFFEPLWPSHRFRYRMSSLDPSSSPLVLISPRGPRESQERVHRTCGPGGTCYASRAWCRKQIDKAKRAPDGFSLFFKTTSCRRSRHSASCRFFSAGCLVCFLKGAAACL